MERGSDKSGPRVDEELEKQTEAMERGAPVPARSEGFREHEGATDEEAPPDARLSGDRGLTRKGALGPDELEARSELARHLDPAVFPAERPALLEDARANQAPRQVLAALEALPQNTTFQNVEAVWEALGGRREER
jgi:Protein of unknown function (DUF2795)